MKKRTIEEDDARWGGYIPWFLRHQGYSGTGQFLLFFSRIGHRLKQLVTFNEVGISNIVHFGSIIESKSLQRFRFDISKPLALEISNYFDPKTLNQDMKARLDEDPEEVELANYFSQHFAIRAKQAYTLIDIGNVKKKLKEESKLLEVKVESTRKMRSELHYATIFAQRIGVLEIILKNIPQSSPWFGDLVQDIRSYLAEAGIMLDIDLITCHIVATEEPLLQKEVLDSLLPRLQSRFPERAAELVSVYHKMVSGEKFDEIFVSAYKTLEAIARDITGDKNFEFTQQYLTQYFPKLHSTIRSSIIKLGAHRGDKAGHGREAPESFEMRYLIFSVCNVALLLLDYN